MPGGRNRIALDQRPPGEGALERVGRPLKADVGLRRREDDLGGRLGLSLADLDIVARADAGIGALEAVEADNVDILDLAVRPDRTRGGRTLANDLDHITFGEP